MFTQFNSFCFSHLCELECRPLPRCEECGMRPAWEGGLFDRAGFRNPDATLRKSCCLRSVVNVKIRRTGQTENRICTITFRFTLLYGLWTSSLNKCNYKQLNPLNHLISYIIGTVGTYLLKILLLFLTIYLPLVEMREE